MLAFKTHLVIQDPQHTVLPSLPFRSGQKVEVVIISEDEETTNRTKAIKKLLKETQALPEAKDISEADIKKEIDLHRKKK